MPWFLVQDTDIEFVGEKWRYNWHPMETAETFASTFLASDQVAYHFYVYILFSTILTLFTFLCAHFQLGIQPRSGLHTHVWVRHGFCRINPSHHHLEPSRITVRFCSPPAVLDDSFQLCRNSLIRTPSFVEGHVYPKGNVCKYFLGFVTNEKQNTETNEVQ